MTGGVFSAALFDLVCGAGAGGLDQDADGFVSWYELLPRLQRRSRELYGELRSSALQRADVPRDIRSKLQSQLRQTPQAFHLPQPLAGTDTREFYAGNLGIFFQMVPHGQTFAARLTRDPLAETPGERLRFEPGDAVVELDDCVLREPIDVQLHRLQTTVRFVNVRTGNLQTAQADLGPWIVPDFKAGNLEVCYVLHPYGGASGVRLTRDAQGRDAVRRAAIGGGRHARGTGRGPDPLARRRAEPLRPHGLEVRERADGQSADGRGHVVQPFGPADRAAGFRLELTPAPG